MTLISNLFIAYILFGNYLCASALSVAAAGGTIAEFAAEGSTKRLVCARIGFANRMILDLLIRNAVMSVHATAMATIVSTTESFVVLPGQSRNGVD